MKLLRLSLAFTITILYTSTLVYAQNAAKPIDTVKNSLHLYPQLEAALKNVVSNAENNPTENVFIQLNKPWYSRADTMWFKVYTVIGQTHQLSALSSTVNVELIAIGDTAAIGSIKLKLVSGMASGDFTLPNSIKPGIYHLRAYTDWMKSRQQTIYDRTVHVGGLAPETAIMNSKSTGNPVSDVQFFPEGGTLVTGLRSKVAFKATKPDGTPEHVKGYIADGTTGDTIAFINSGHAGMGAFALSPQSGKSYNAYVETDDGRRITATLPTTLPSGYSFTVNNTGADSINVTIQANSALQRSAPAEVFYLVAQSSGKIGFVASGKAGEGVCKIRIPKDRFPSGIVRLTLFSSAGEPLNERVAYIDRADKMHLDVQSGKDVYTTGEKISININNKEKANATALSAAVINESILPADENNEATIFTDLLLSPELRGNVYDPGYYFAHNDDQTRADLDLLMLTQGFRKLDWKKMDDAANGANVSYGFTISGRVTTKNKPAVRARIVLLIPETVFALDTLTDADGRFSFTNLDLQGKTRIVIKASSEKTKNLDVSIDKPEAAQKLAMRASNEVISDNKALAAMKQSYLDDELAIKNSKLLKEVEVKANNSKKKAPDLSFSANLNGPGHADQVITGETLSNMGCVTLAQCLQSKLAFVKVNVGPPASVTDMSRGIKLSGNGPMAIYIDGTRGSLDEINPNDVYSVEALTSAVYKSIYGTDAANGLLLITTKRGTTSYEHGDDFKLPGIANFIYDGYYKTRTFYQPKYDINSAASVQQAAIYWKPDILTGNDGKAILEYNNLGKGNYRVVIEGIDATGKLGRMVYRYKVE